MSARLPLVALLLAVAACGGKGSPSSPAPTLNLTGTWGGTWTFVTSGVTVSDTVAATLTQSGPGVNGTWTSQSGATGQFTNLTPAASTSGTVSISLTTITGAVCNATVSATGTASASTIELTLGAIPPSGVCVWATGQRFSLTRQ